MLVQVLVKEPELRQVGEGIVQKYYMAVEGVKAVKGHQVRSLLSHARMSALHVHKSCNITTPLIWPSINTR